ncbi:RtcB family protein [Solirubrobacter sp. CPCC 204708]|uniref:3'-phosphate/5'-hydroxy nucleic acid ligase n=1 Tax=Solirubrobacter deserti TaxID=2282478 RepID=A0ABT4RK84_9ACTN|nr:RtcB family protein [Solirubrobacter deserti]MBE2316851.1 RtcB family protein [Solirubrobacter deserti]MDA0138932.1 RtcB family protein [Solirubrobacter deserti]
MDAGGVDDALAAWARRTGERDSQLGSLGGGHHFCELQRVAELCDGPTAWAWGLRRGALAVMVHAGSLGFGHVARSRGGTEPFLRAGPEQDAYVRAQHNAANLAFANRLALTAMAVGAVAHELGSPPRWVTVGDAPHNLIWREGDIWRHRKGACPALLGKPVLIPGSMGDSSWVLAGTGAEAALASTSHAAGRVLARGRAARTRDDQADARLRVVTPVDPLRVRRDVRNEHARRVREEAPRAYKPIGPVVDAVVAAGAARRVARLEPLLTVKG